MKDRNRRFRDDDHRDRQAEIKLHETHTVDVCLSSRGNERDGGSLGGHNRQRHRVPRHFFPGKQVLVGGR
jgi:hypothetical protein